MRIVSIIVGLFLLSTPAFAEGGRVECHSEHGLTPICISALNFVPDTCFAIKQLARRNGLNPHFFTRLIWQESRFDPNARSPANAQGIAQFIPSTAKIKGLSDPFNPAEALTVSARYLAELTNKFGNEGLAAVAYNAGETAAADFKAKRRAGVPDETWNYVQIITGFTASQWRDGSPETNFHLNEGYDFFAACLRLARDRIYSEFRPVVQRKPWGVQFASGRTRSRAAASYRRKTQTCKRLLVGKRPSFVRTRPPSGARKRIYAARIGLDKRSDAIRLCARVKIKGCTCAVYKN